MLSIGIFSLLPVWPGSDAELPNDRLPLLINFSQGVLLTVKAGARERERERGQREVNSECN